jgi:hypothetical protein
MKEREKLMKRCKDKEFNNKERKKLETMLFMIDKVFIEEMMKT